MHKSTSVVAEEAMVMTALPLRGLTRMFEVCVCEKDEQDDDDDVAPHLALMSRGAAFL